MTTCPSCGHQNPEGQRFCGDCGSPLGEASVRPAAEERKVVTIVFCDLVNFTARSEMLDPEDVRAFLLPYYELFTSETERHGGTIDKFLGDGVMAVFGAPTSFEDDPERAVRMALRVMERLPELDLDLHVRIGVNTGEVMVAMEAMDRGDAITGDAANTAARLQTVAPVDGIVVGERTWEATSSIFDFEELEPAHLKGKSAPVRAFLAISSKARLGIDLTRTYDSPFIGHEIDLALLKSTFDEMLDASSPQLVTVVGEPGLGKSRIVAELRAYVDDRSDFITWRQGRCLPYGEGITFWALGEVLKAHAGILESDPPDVATTKLDAVLPEGDERSWFRERLLPLLGIEAASSGEREELFTAARRFLEHIAEGGPTVLVFEDLHWADEAMLSFLEHLADRAQRVPLLVVGTARPELYERHPRYAAGLRDTVDINLAPLSDEETARLVSALLDTTAIPPELQQPILDRAGGNPLYAEEFVRLLRDRDLVVKEGSSWQLVDGAEVPFPDSVHALIAARLDTLSPDAKSMLADAAVVGKVFWAGALVHMGERELSTVTETLRVLSRKELVRQAPRTSIEGESEYAFWHVLARDVAYGQLPRASRASRHVAAARWIESVVPGRVEDMADVLAYHYTTALDLARVAGQTEQATDLEEPALRFLSLAGERALGLDAGTALANLERALVLAPEGHPERPEALVRFGEAALEAGRYSESQEALEEAIDTFRAMGDPRSAAGAMDMLGIVIRPLGDPRWTQLPDEALALLEPLPPSPELIGALLSASARESLQGRHANAHRFAERALVLADELDLPRPARAMGLAANSRIEMGDAGGLQEFREAIVIATDAGRGRLVADLTNTLGVCLWAFEGPAAALRVFRDGISFAQARGLSAQSDANSVSALDALVDMGGYAEVSEVAADMSSRLEASGDVFGLSVIRATLARIATLQGRANEVAGSLDWLEATTRSLGSAEFMVFGLGSSASARATLGQEDAAITLLVELEAYSAARDNEYYAALLPAMVRTVLRFGEAALADRFVGRYEPRYPYAEHSFVTAEASIAEDRGDLQSAAEGYADAADRWDRFGVVHEHGFALLGHGRCLLGLDRSAEAGPILEQAQTIFGRLHAAPALAETDALLKQLNVE